MRKALAGQGDRLAPEAKKEARKAQAPKVKHVCGHEVPLADFAGRPCGRCRNEASQKKAREKKERKAQKAQRPRAHPGADVLPDGRLPAGSSKVLAWDGALWRGVLDVPGVGRFEYEAGSESKCFHGLHNAFVEYLRKRKGESDERGV